MNFYFAERAIAAILIAGSAWFAPASAETTTTDCRVFQAYYLEQKEQDFAAAEKLYDEVAGDRKASEADRKAARARAAACREEVIASDLGRLLPGRAIAYVELRQPGKHLKRLLDRAGLLLDESGKSNGDGPNVAISPILLDELLGLEGISVALTGVDFANEMPTAVGVVHPGNIDVIRGLLQTALPAAAKRIAPVEQFDTFQIEDKLIVTVTHRLIFVGTHRHEVEAAVARLSDGGTDSLAALRKDEGFFPRDENALLQFAVNAEPLMPVIRAGMAAAASQDKDLAVAQALLDIDSFKHLTGAIGVRDNEIYADVQLTLAENHQNVVFDLLRLPAFDPTMLECVPADAAAGLLLSLNEADSRFGDAKRGKGTDTRIRVAALDIGREFFGNLTGIAAFVLPSFNETNPEIPDVALVLRSRDLAKTNALWRQFLGIASLATGSVPIEGNAITVAGADVTAFPIENEVTIHTLAMDDAFVIAPSRSAIESVIRARRAKSSMELQRLGDVIANDEPKTIVAFAFPARCLEMAKHHMSGDEVRRVEPVIAALSQTVATFFTSQTENAFHIGARLHGIPRMDGIIRQAMQEHALAGPSHDHVDSARVATPTELGDQLIVEQENIPAGR